MKGVFIAKLNVEETKEMHSDPDLYNRRYAVASVNTYYNQGYGTVTLKEIAAMEKQPEYEYAPIELDEIGEWVDGSWCYASNLHFEWSKSNIVSIEEVSAIHLIQNPHKLVQRVELTPEQKREREVGELGRRLLVTYEHCNGTWQDKFEAVARDAIEWMESKKEQGMSNAVSIKARKPRKPSKQEAEKILKPMYKELEDLKVKIGVLIEKMGLEERSLLDKKEAARRRVLRNADGLKW